MQKNLARPFYQQTVEECSAALNAHLQQGLTNQEALARLHNEGRNTLSQNLRYESFITIFFKQFRSSLIYILLLAAALIFILGYFADAFVVSGILLFNAILGTFQEEKAQTILKGLQQYIKKTCVVIRDGKAKIIPVEEVVRGDLLQLQEGEQVPADARIVQSYNLKIDEALLTGESHAVIKQSAPLNQTAPLADQKNMLFKGTYIVMGSGFALVTATGDATQIGQLKIITEQEVMRDFPLKKKLDTLSNSIILYLFIVCIALFIVGLALGKPLKELLSILAALFICIIPEGLPVVFTLSLISGTQRMAQCNVLIKKLQAVEGLGATEVIIIDKTGTLTRNEMVVTNVFFDTKYLTVSGQGYFKEGNIFYNNQPYTDPSLTFLAQACSLLDQTIITYDPKTHLFSIKGEPMESALGIFAEKIIGANQLEKKYTIVHKLPFDYKTRTKAVFLLNNQDDTMLTFISGAPEAILSACAQKNNEAHDAMHTFFSQGLRLMALGYKKTSRHAFEEARKKTPEQFYEQWITSDVQFLALVGIQDAVRPEVAHVIADTRKAGLNVVMATGDHVDTALSVAKKVHIFGPGDSYLEGSDLDLLSDEELLARLDTITVFARVTPQQKLRIITLYQQRGTTVAMTGDGVNDAPALVAADLGIAMGRIGTEVAKQASDIILLDDSFVSIVEAIKEGRHIFFILRRVTYYFFTTNLSELFLIAFALISSLPLPLFPAQILWLNLITDGFLDLSLSEEPRKEDMLQKPIKSQQLITKQLLIKIVYLSLPMALMSLAVFYYYQADLPLARTMTLTLMAMLQWFNIWNCRSETQSIFKLGFLSNKWLVAACILVLALQLIVIYVPFMQTLFRTVPLTVSQWMLILGLSSTIIVFEETKKWFSKVN